ncbi:MAG TPA: PilW family protein [Usitatibacteraceae bacterium]|jgi:type IV pilus assembly protein PilW|nr:PilW family protein [Usitatibacteraceae bacterium]
MRTAPSRSQSGFTIVELMVGTLVALVATVIIFQVFAVSEGQKRTTTGASDAQQNGGFSLFQIERDLRMAGYGLNHMALLGCRINGWYEPGGAGFNFRLVPVEIINGVGGAPDQIRIAFGNSDLFTAPAKMLQSMPSPAANYKVDNRFGFREGDLVVAAENGKDCSLAQVSGVPGTPGLSDNVIHNSGNYTNSEGANVPTQFNRPGGLPPPNDVSYGAWNPATNTGGRLYNLGAAPTVVTYAIQNSQLVSINGLTPGVPTATAVLSDGIVQLQAQYGYDGNGDGQLPMTAPSNAAVTLGTNTDQWSDSMPAAATAVDWSRVIAVRLVITSRSVTPERPNPATGLCETTTTFPRWVAPAPGASPPGTPLDVQAAFADANEWRCYRYRAFEVVVPLRNMVWFPQVA